MPAAGERGRSLHAARRGSQRPERCPLSDRSLCLRAADRRQAQAAFGGRFARLDPGQPPEAWLGIGFRDRSGSPPRGCGRRGGYLALGEVRIEWRLSFQQHTSEAKQAVGNTSEGAAVRFAAPA